VTIGGGSVVDTEKSPKGVEIGPRLDVLSGSDPSRRIALLVREAEFGLGLAELVARTGMPEPEIVSAAARAPLVVPSQPQPWFVDRSWFQSASERLVKAVREFHRTQPLLPGIARQDLRSRELPGAPLFLLEALLAAARDLAVEGETVRLRTHSLVLKQDEAQARAAIERAFEQAGLSTPAVPEVLAKSGVGAAQARSLLEILLREKRLVRINEELVFHSSAIDRLRHDLAARRPARFNVGTFKEWTGISRKYAIPLLEYLDRAHVTRREGDERLII
jgi:selenocysteine-specific elongation factor